MGFYRFVHPLAAHGLVKIHLVRIELWAIHAGEHHFTPNAHSASTAHPCGIHHQGIEAGHRWDSKLLGEGRDEFHHNHGANRHSVVIALSVVEHQILKAVCHHPVKSIAPVIGSLVVVGCHRLHFTAVDLNALGLRPYNHIGLEPPFGQIFNLRVDGCCPHATTYENDTFLRELRIGHLHQVARAS